MLFANFLSNKFGWFAEWPEKQAAMLNIIRAILLFDGMDPTEPTYTTSAPEREYLDVASRRVQGEAARRMISRCYRAESHGWGSYREVCYLLLHIPVPAPRAIDWSGGRFDRLDLLPEQSMPEDAWP